MARGAVNRHGAFDGHEDKALEDVALCLGVADDREAVCDDRQHTRFHEFNDHWDCGVVVAADDFADASDSVAHLGQHFVEVCVPPAMRVEHNTKIRELLFGGKLLLAEVEGDAERVKLFLADFVLFDAVAGATARLSLRCESHHAAFVDVEDHSPVRGPDRELVKSGLELHLTS